MIESSDDPGRLGAYDLLARLPAYGTVEPWVARRQGEVELVIVKRLQSRLSNVISVQQRFAREASLARHVAHEHLVAVKDVGEVEGASFLVTDFVVGPSLAHLLERARQAQVKLPLSIVGAIIRPVIDAIAHAHEAEDDNGRKLSIVHRDLAPKSIVVTLTGDIRVNDFGVAHAQVQDFQTAPGLAVGTAEYLSPEQVRAEQVTASTDIYTLGVVLHEMLTGEALIDPERPLLERLRTVASVVVPSLVTTPGVSNKLADTVSRATAKEPARRFASARAFDFALQEALPEQASREQLAEFVRRLLPEEEDRVLEILESVRLASAKIESEVEPEVERTEVTRLRVAFLPESEEPPEPSVMTMPGQLLTSTGRVVVGEPDLSPLSAKPKPRGEAPRARRRQPDVGTAAKVAAGLIAVAVFVLVGVWWGTGPEPLRINESSQAPGARPIAAAQNGPGASAAAAVEPDPPAAAPASPPPRSRSGARTSAKSAPPAKSASTGSREQASTSAKTAATKAPAKKAPAPESSKAESGKAESSKAETPPRSGTPSRASRRLQAKLTRLRASPKDVRLFDSMRASIASLAKQLPPGARRQVEADLSAADRTLDIELLQSALDRVRRAGL